MGWKEFLKPDWRKIIVFLSIPIIYLLLLATLGRIDFMLKIITGLYGALILPIFIFWMFLNKVGINPFPDIATGSSTEIFGELILVLFAIIWMHIVSCVLISIYDKLKS